MRNACGEGRSNGQKTKASEAKAHLSWPYLAQQEEVMAKKPCWKGYQMVGTKKKGGRTVPNCVPKKGKK